MSETFSEKIKRLEAEQAARMRDTEALFHLAAAIKAMGAGDFVEAARCQSRAAALMSR